MDKLISVAQVVAPIFLAIFLGIYAKKKNILTPEQNSGFQQFVMKFGLPCVLFNSCLTADLNTESLSSMAMVIPVVTLSTLWAFRARKKRYPYYNLPMMFAAQETGMLGIPLVMVLFGADQAYRMGVLDLAQGVMAYPVIAMLTSDAGENPSPAKIIKSMITSPFVIMAVLGLTLNLTGAAEWLDGVGIGEVITAPTSFIAQPVSTVMLFSVGYNFTLEKGHRATIFKLSAVHFGYFAIAGCVIQGLLCLIPGVDMVTRLVLLMYCTLPASYLAPSFGRGQEDNVVAAGVCSVLTVVSLAIFCCITAAVT